LGYLGPLGQTKIDEADGFIELNDFSLRYSRVDKDQNKKLEEQ
jgi:hypothetical protein